MSKLEYKAVPELLEDGKFKVNESMYDHEQRIVKKWTTGIIDTKEFAIRNALIALGWTPPPKELKNKKRTEGKEI